MMESVVEVKGMRMIDTKMIRQEPAGKSGDVLQPLEFLTHAHLP
jgi:hypothetical protein